MKQVSTGYKNQIKEMGREIDSIIRYYNHYQVITENNKYILTEDGQKLLTEQIKEDSYIDITAEDIYSVKLITHGDLLKTMMKELDFEVRQDMKIGSIVSYKFGLKVNGEYEYVDYGTFIVNEKEYNEDTQTYSYKAYDMMLKSMIPYKDTNDYPTTLYDVLNNVLEYCGLGLGVSEFPNSERDIYDDPFSGLDITCRDVLDFITEVTGCSSYMDGNDFIIMWPNDTDLTLDENSFKDTNVKFNEVYGPINSILFSRSEDTDVVEIKDETSIEQNGVTQIKIKDNPLLEDNDRDEYFQEMFDVLNGMTYTLNEYSSTGITYLDYYDKYKVIIGENEYDCIMINDEINVEQGLTENVFTEKPEENQDKYVTSRLSDKGEKWANIQVKKDLGEITLEVGQISEELDDKVGNNEIITKINLSPEQASIQSNKISLQGKTIALTSENINIASNNFSVDTAGNMTCNNATMTNAHIVNGSIDITQESGSTALPIYLTQVSNGITYNSRYGSGGIRFIRNGVDMAGLYGNPSSSSNTGGYLTLNNISGTRTLLARGNDSTNNGGYFQIGNSSGTATIWGYGYSGQWVCTSLVQTSLEEEKKNFEELKNALDIIKDVDIYKYNFKFENDDDKKHIGFVIGDKYNYRKEITSLNNNGVDTYSMISVLWQAVKEQQKEIEELKERIGK